MTTITTKDGTEIFYKDWGPKTAQPIVFHHGWPLSGDDWDNQMLYFLDKGYRVIAHDRRGHGRSAQVSDGHDMDHYAADVAAVVEHRQIRSFTGSATAQNDERRPSASGLCPALPNRPANRSEQRCACPTGCEPDFQESIMLIDSLRAATSARLVAINVDDTLQTAALCLSRAGIGLILVCRESGEAGGVLTKSDLVRHLTRAGAADEPVAPLMSRPIVSCRPNDDVYSVWQIMTARKLQNVPVLGVDLKPLGVLDIRDAMAALLEQEQFEEHMLVDYITGIGYR